MPEIEVPCPTCSATGNMTPGGGRNNLKDRCTTCGGRRTIPARPGESRETSWPFAVPAASQAPSSTPGEAERLVDALIEATTEHTYLSALDVGAKAEITEALAACDTARTALLSHISAAGRGEGAGDLAALSAAASPGMLALSPRQYDDWGMIRTTEPDSDGFGRVIFHAVILDDDAEKSAARSERRQPKIVKANADFLIRLWNDYRSGRLVERSAADDQTARFVAESNTLERQERALVAAERAYREAFDAYASLHLTALRHRVAMRAALSAADANPQDQE